MAERHVEIRTDEQGMARGTLKRRGILAAAGAAVAGLLAKQAAQPVGATHQPEDLGLGITNTTTGITRLQYTPTGLSGSFIMAVQDGGAEPGTSHPAALAGFAIKNFGVTGNVNIGVYGATTSPAADGAGVRGDHFYSGTGVYGEAFSGGTGVSGTAGAGGNGVLASSSGTGNGVKATCYGTTTAYAVWGLSDAGKGVVGSATTGTGVYGASDATSASDGNGVYGVVNHVGNTQVTAGVFGDSTASYGILGRTTAAGYSGCTGIATGANRAAFAGAGTGGAYGAYFTGPTVVQGNFTVVGGAKNAAVKHTDGSYRLLHCVESPEPWFEDFGEAKLVNGRADVKLDADFAAVVDTSSYRVFVVPEGDCKGLYVTAKGGGGFSVREMQGGTGTLGFSYRVVAKRKDINPGRMAKFELPKIRLPKPEEMPPPPAPPKKP